MYKIFQNQKGFSLVELMVVLALLMLVVSLGFNLLFFGSQAYIRSASQQIIQSNVRFAVSSINELVKYSVSVEILNEKPNSMEDPYSFLYLDNNQLIMSYISSNGDRLERVINNDIDSIAFWDASADKELLGLIITGTENDQRYEIEQEIALFNYSLEQQNLTFIDSTTSGNGTAIKFINDIDLVPLDQTNILRLNREADFELYPGETFRFMANMKVTWHSGDPSIVTIDSDGLATASGEAEQSTTITAKSIDDFALWKSVVITIVDRKDYHVIITDRYYNPIVATLNIVKESEEIIHAVITPELTNEYTIYEVYWYTPNEDDQSYITLNNTSEDATTVSVEGVSVGNDANLSVRVTLKDSDDNEFVLKEDSIIVNVMPTVEYAKLIDIWVHQSTNLSPSFSPDIESYTFSGNGLQNIRFETDTGATISIKEGSSGEWEELNVNSHTVSYNLSQVTVDLYVRVSQQGKLDRVYHISSN